MKASKRVIAGFLFTTAVTVAFGPALAQKNPERNAYFGEQHVHTSWSVDAWLFGNHLTGPDDALKAVNYLRPRIVIPMHYNTFPVITADASGWANRVNSLTNATPIVLDPGGSYTLA